MPVNQDLEWAIEDVRSRADRYGLMRDYDEGRHRLLFATEKYRNAFGDLFREFSDNVCDDVLDGITDRLQIVSWTSPDKTLNARCDELWTRVKGEARTGAVHRNAFREGDGFVVLEQGPDTRARMFKQNPATMAVRYSADDPDLADLFAKVWRSGKRWRANLYYPDRTERYASKGTSANGGLPRAAAFALLSSADAALADMDDPTPVTANDDPLNRIPVYHFPNGEPSAYGKSLLRGVIPLQDALNKAIADMLVAMEFHAYPQRWATGVQVERDEQGNEIQPFQAGEGRLWRTGNKEATFGQFDPAAMDGFLDVQDAFRLEAARKGCLPPHSVRTRDGGQAPSGISLLVAEGRTVKMAKDRQRDWGTDHKGWVAHGLTMDLGALIEPDDLDLTWAPPETRDMKALLEELTLKKELGVPVEQLLKEAGYDTDQVDEFLDQQEAADEAERAAMSVLQGGRTVATIGQAATLNGSLGLPGGPVPPNGGQSALVGA